MQVVHQRAAGLLALATEHAAAQQGLDPRLQLGQFERLGQAVDRTEAFDPNKNNNGVTPRCCPPSLRRLRLPVACTLVPLPSPVPSPLSASPR
uniref:Fumarate hydratase n=1 Tax=Steinernema glaseri TaxID=37863 RepID=A0A1I7Y3C8_9BILA